MRLIAHNAKERGLRKDFKKMTQRGRENKEWKRNETCNMTLISIVNCLGPWAQCQFGSNFL